MSGQLSDFHPSYKAKLNENAGKLIWTFHMRAIMFTLSGFDVGTAKYGMAVVLVSTHADFLNENAEGYAVVSLGKGNSAGSSSERVFKLVRFSGGLNSDSNITNLISSKAGDIFGKNHVSVKVSYEPATDKWELYIRDDGGGSSAAYIPDGWQSSNFFFTGLLDRGNNKYEGHACARLLTTREEASLTLPPMQAIGDLKFYAKRYANDGIVGNIRILCQVDENDWVEIVDLGDIMNMEYQEFIVPVNKTASESMLIQLKVTRIGDNIDSEGYYFDDFAYTAYMPPNTATFTLDFEHIDIKPLTRGFVINTHDIDTRVVVFNTLGAVQWTGQVKGMQTVNLPTSGIYLIHVESNNQSHLIKHFVK